MVLPGLTLDAESPQPAATLWISKLTVSRWKYRFLSGQHGCNLRFRSGHLRAWRPYRIRLGRGGCGDSGISGRLSARETHQGELFKCETIFGHSRQILPSSTSITPTTTRLLCSRRRRQSFFPRPKASTQPPFASNLRFAMGGLITPQPQSLIIDRFTVRERTRRRGGTDRELTGADSHGKPSIS
jgi:hypothetical protein